MGRGSKGFDIAVSLKSAKGNYTHDCGDLYLCGFVIYGI